MAEDSCYSSIVFTFDRFSATCPFFYEGSARIYGPAFGSFIALLGLNVLCLGVCGHCSLSLSGSSQEVTEVSSAMSSSGSTFSVDVSQKTFGAPLTMSVPVTQVTSVVR